MILYVYYHILSPSRINNVTSIETVYVPFIRDIFNILLAWRLIPRISLYLGIFGSFALDHRKIPNFTCMSIVYMGTGMFTCVWLHMYLFVTIHMCTCVYVWNLSMSATVYILQKFMIVVRSSFIVYNSLYKLTRGILK